MGNPVLLLLDEPSEGVAPIIVEDLAKALLLLKEQGLSILLSEQNVAFAQIVADRVYMLEQGQIRWTGMMQELVHNSEIQRSHLAL
jgi:branched-chain amino acid transport system ATP-binding protein